MRQLIEEYTWRIEPLDAFMARAHCNNQLLMARKIGSTQQHISHMIVGRNYMRQETARSLAPMLGVPWTDLRLACVLWLLRRRLEDGTARHPDHSKWYEVAPLVRTHDQYRALWQTFTMVQLSQQKQHMSLLEEAMNANPFLFDATPQRPAGVQQP